MHKESGCSRCLMPQRRLPPHPLRRLNQLLRPRPHPHPHHRQQPRLLLLSPQLHPLHGQVRRQLSPKFLLPQSLPLPHRRPRLLPSRHQPNSRHQRCRSRRLKRQLPLRQNPPLRLQLRLRLPRPSRLLRQPLNRNRLPRPLLPARSSGNTRCPHPANRKRRRCERAWLCMTTVSLPVWEIG